MAPVVVMKIEFCVIPIKLAAPLVKISLPGLTALSITIDVITALLEPGAV